MVYSRNKEQKYCNAKHQTELTVTCDIIQYTVVGIPFVYNHACDPERTNELLFICTFIIITPKLPEKNAK